MNPFNHITYTSHELDRESPVPPRAVVRQFVLDFDAAHGITVSAHDLEAITDIVLAYLWDRLRSDPRLRPI